MAETIFKQITLFEYIKPREVIIKGLCDDGYCPRCNGCLEDLVPECPYCQQDVTWEHWKEVNAEWLSEKHTAYSNNQEHSKKNS